MSISSTDFDREASGILRGVSAAVGRAEQSVIKLGQIRASGEEPQVKSEAILKMGCPAVKECWQRSATYILSCIWEWIKFVFVTTPSNINQELFQACAERNFSRAWTLIQNGANVNAKFQNVDIGSLSGDEEVTTYSRYREVSLLQIACMRGDYQLASWLIKQGADINAVVGIKAPVSNQGCLASLLHMAVAREDTTLAEWLLDNGANIEAPCYSYYSNDGEPINKSESTPLHWACALGGGHSEQMVGILINRGANTKATKDGSPLHIACMKGNAGAMKALMKENGDINGQEKDGQTPLHKAVETNNQEFVLMLMTKYKADPNKANNRNETSQSAPQTALQKAYELGYIDLAKAMIRNGGNAADLFDQAIKKDDWAFIMFLIDNKANIDTSFIRGNTLLHLASRNDALRPYLKQLLEKGADARLKNTGMQLPLHVAVMNGALGCAKEILTAKPELINETDASGRTAMHYAASMEASSQMIQLFVQHGANLDVFDKSKTPMTALHYAVAGKQYANAAAIFKWHQPGTRKIDAQAAVAYLQPNDEQMKALLKQHGAIVDPKQRSSSPPKIGDVSGAFWSLLGYDV